MPPSEQTDPATPPVFGDIWPAPAKLNLFLHVTGRRADGYHLLQTVFQFLDFADGLEFIPRQDDRITLTGNQDNVAPEHDLITRSARRLQEHSGCSRGVDIIVHKRLPFGGGLGGGSSDAATTLVALNHLWGLDLGTDELSSIGLNLGADVPVFVYGRAAWAEGIGEQLTPVEPPEHWFLVISPGMHVSTAEVFNSPDLTRNTPAITIRDFLTGAGHNDCERVARMICPEVDNLLNWLGKIVPARMTGSGACVFSSFATRQQAQAVLEIVPRPWWGFVARGRNRSPLLDKLDEVKPGHTG